MFLAALAPLQPRWASDLILCSRHHPDQSRKPDAQRRFLRIQEAYELVIGRKRGKDVPSKGGKSWDFHDWCETPPTLPLDWHNPYVD